jgi:hypothetical protein
MVDMLNNNNISEDEGGLQIGEERSSKIHNYDSSVFSKKMAEVDKRGGGSHLTFLNN